MTARSVPSRLDAEWRLAPDGRYEREAARLILFDVAGRVLLVRGHTLERPGESWWFTVGGGIGAGEEPRQAAVRELFEESGIRIGACELLGPVCRRLAEFTFLGMPVRQREQFFLATAPAATASLDDSGWTDVEREFIDELCWWTTDELTATDEVIYPGGFAVLAASLARGWDGTVRELEPERDADG